MSAPAFVFVGAKGGSGTTTVCAELVKSMRAERNIALVDGDLSGRRSDAILFDAIRPLDASREMGPIGVTRVAGFTLAELAPSYEWAFTLKFTDVEGLAASLETFDCVFVDAPLPLNMPLRPFVMRATRFVVVAEPTLLGLTGARALLADLLRFGVPRERVVLVLNNRDGRPTTTSAQVERALEIKVIGEIPTLHDRSYAKRIAALARTLRSIESEPQIETLLPSVKGFNLDRRTARRAAAGADVAAAGAATEEKEPVAVAAPLRDSGSASTTTANPSDHSLSGAGQPRGREPAGTNGASASRNGNGASAAPGLSARERFKLDIHEALAKNVNLLDASQAYTDAAKFAELRAKIYDLTQGMLAERSMPGSSAEDIIAMKEEIVSEALGLGPLEDLMRDQTVTEIMVNGPKNIYAERYGKIERTGKRFTSEQQLRLVIERIIAPLGRRLDESVPMVDARLPDGSRVNAIIEPLAIDGATLTIRRFGTHRLTMQDLLQKGSANEPMLDFLRACIQGRLNVVISGGTGSGKTTFLNILSNFIPEDDRIITIEDAAELSLNQPHVVRLESRPANIEGRGAVTIRDLVRNALRMRPDRIVVGECRGGEALDMLQAMNTGHDGSLTTAHANTPRDTISRLETMVMMAGFDLPVRAIREQIASAVDLVIQTTRMRDGSRKITSITEVVGMEGDVVTMQEIVRFHQHGLDAEGKVAGEFQYTGVQPSCLQRFAEYGIDYDVRALATLASTGTLW